MKWNSKKLNFYYDTFKDEIVLSKDKNSPPERYFIIYAGIDDIYKDTFVKGDHKLSYAYSSFDEWKEYSAYFLEQNNFTDSRLYSRQFPKKKFVELLKDYGFKVVNDEEIEIGEDDV